MKERYNIIKSIYPNYLILFRKDDSIKALDIDKSKIKIFNINELNTLNKKILNNLDIEEKLEYKNNLYDIYYVKTKLINILNKYRKEVNR